EAQPVDAVIGEVGFLEGEVGVLAAAEVAPVDVVVGDRLELEAVAGARGQVVQQWLVDLGGLVGGIVGFHRQGVLGGGGAGGRKRKQQGRQAGESLHVWTPPLAPGIAGTPRRCQSEGAVQRGRRRPPASSRRRRGWPSSVIPASPAGPTARASLPSGRAQITVPAGCRACPGARPLPARRSRPRLAWPR